MRALLPARGLGFITAEGLRAEVPASLLTLPIPPHLAWIPLMSDAFAFDVFLSHSPKDKEVVREIAMRLKKDAVRVWFDEWEIKPGDHRVAKIEEGVESSRVLVFCMSAHSMGSDWARLAPLNLRHSDPLNKNQRIILLRLDQTSPPKSLNSVPAIDWASSYAYPSLRRVVGGSDDQLFGETVSSQGGIDVSNGAGIEAAAVSLSGSRVLVADRGGMLALWDLGGRFCVRALQIGLRKIVHIEWASDESKALVVAVDGAALLIGMPTLEILRDFRNCKMTTKQMNVFRLVAGGLGGMQIERRLNIHHLTAWGTSLHSESICESNRWTS